MSVAMMAANRLKFGAGDIAGGTDGEKVAAVDPYLYYCGRMDGSQFLRNEDRLTPFSNGLVTLTVENYVTNIYYMK